MDKLASRLRAYAEDYNRQEAIDNCKWLADYFDDLTDEREFSFRHTLPNEIEA